MGCLYGQIVRFEVEPLWWQDVRAVVRHHDGFHILEFEKDFWLEEHLTLPAIHLRRAEARLRGNGLPAQKGDAGVAARLAEVVGRPELIGAAAQLGRELGAQRV